MNEAARQQPVQRPATQQDALALSRLWFMSSLGILPYYLDGLKPGLEGAALFAHQLAMTGSPYGYPRWRVAEQAGEVLGAINVYTHEEAATLKDMPVRQMLAVGPVGLGRFVYRSWQLGDLLGWRVKNRLFAVMHHDHLPNTLYVNCMGVAPQAQNRGIGSALLDWARQEAARRGADTLSLHVWGDNHRAIALYRRFGFEETVRHFPVLPPALCHHTEGKVHMVARVG